MIDGAGGIGTRAAIIADALCLCRHSSLAKRATTAFEPISR